MVLQRGPIPFWTTDYLLRCGSVWNFVSSIQNTTPAIANSNANHPIQAHNPWHRLLSVHDWEGRPWAFAGENWPTYIASQDGNKASPEVINRYVASLRVHGIPVLADEFGGNRTNSEVKVRNKLWAAFCAGAAGTGTGTDLKSFQRFLSQSRIPFQRMEPHNELVEDGGSSCFCLSESGHHYLVYSTTGPFTLSITGTDLKGYYRFTRSSTVQHAVIAPIRLWTRESWVGNSSVRISFAQRQLSLTSSGFVRIC